MHITDSGNHFDDVLCIPLVMSGAGFSGERHFSIFHFDFEVRGVQVRVISKRLADIFANTLIRSAVAARAKIAICACFDRACALGVEFVAGPPSLPNTRLRLMASLRHRRARARFPKTPQSAREFEACAVLDMQSRVDAAMELSRTLADPQSHLLIERGECPLPVDGDLGRQTFCTPVLHSCAFRDILTRRSFMEDVSCQHAKPQAEATCRRGLERFFYFS
jgi:hypothetical protein